ncbi:Redox-sensitive transcriptional activator SoxR [hydrothermal vent metagenome]|uniref:Redox-sensitive transcriptional activator SoxR n=1 Tax=hydrothermal vent metagenome TaxID=652676 RepID=A0A3B0VY39_9ZZZZ
MNKKIQSANLSVGDVAKRSGVKVSTLHFYEQKQLIHSVRNAGNQRRYNRDVLRRIGVIKAAQKVGISLNDIQQALNFLPKDKAPTKRDWSRLSKQWKAQLDQQIRQLSALRDNMSSCIGCGCLSLKSCPLYNPDDELGKKQSGAVLLDKAAEK